jgi:hypothetical protein
MMSLFCFPVTSSPLVTIYLILAVWGEERTCDLGEAIFERRNERSTNILHDPPATYRCKKKSKYPKSAAQRIQRRRYVLD